MKQTLYLFIIFFALFSCDTINPDEDVPSFIELESFSVLETPNVGSIRQNITEGWVFVDNVLIGAFAQDKPFPVLAGGTVDIIVEPGVHENGIAFTPSLYPFYTRYSTTTDLVRGEVTTIKPEFEYRENADFQLIQDFDGNTVFTSDIDENEETRIEFTTDGALEGTSAIIHLDSENPSFNVGSNIVFDLPTTGQNDTWLEISFKTDVLLAVGLISQDFDGNSTQLYFNRLNPTAEWKKLYLNLRETIFANPNPPFQVGFGAELPIGQATGTIMIDNIKLIHFEQ